MMPDVEREPVELTIRKMEIAWEMTQKTLGAHAILSEQKFRRALMSFSGAYDYISATVGGEEEDEEEDAEDGEDEEDAEDEE